MAFNLARLAEDGGDTADADARYSDLLAAAPDMTECLLRRAATRASRGFAAAMELPSGRWRRDRTTSTRWRAWDIC